MQVRGHQRHASDTKEFHEVTKRDALMHFEQELQTLLNTQKDEELKAFYANEMERFAALFGRFLQEEGPSVDWDRIEKLPADAVKDYATLKNPTDKNLVSIFSSIYWYLFGNLADFEWKFMKPFHSFTLNRFVITSTNWS